MSRVATLLIFGVFSLMGLVLSAIVTSRGYIATDALRFWADIMLSWETPDFAEDRLALIYPQLRFYLGLLFYGAFPTPSPAVLGVFSAVIGGVTAAIWYRLLAHHGWPRWAAALWVILLMTHPFVLWSVGRGTGESLAIFAFTLVGWGLSRMAVDQNFKGMIIVATAIAAFFLMDHRFVYYAVALVPLLSLFAPREMLTRSIGSFLLVALFPLIAAVASYLYVSWVFTGDMLAFLNNENSIWYGAYRETAATPWLMQFTGGLIVPFGVSLLLAAGSVPAAAVVAVFLLRAAHWRILVPVLLLVPVIALTVSTFVGFAAHPVEFLVLAMVAQVFALTAPTVRMLAPLFVGLVLVGHAVGWLTVFAWQNDDLNRWTTALQAPVGAEIHQPERALAAWLPSIIDDVMIDHESAYPMIVARGTAAGLVLPTTERFKIAITASTLSTDYVAVPSPDTRWGARDQINQNFPDLYRRGHDDYDLVYDRGGWRVFQAEGRGLLLPTLPRPAPVGPIAGG